MTSEPTVGLCIPAYRAEDFIGRTLACARAQTYERLRIHVSVDGSHDATQDICHRVAAVDDRVAVAVRGGGLGWSRNSNAALGMATADVVGIYFHDDVIEPTYVERLVQALAARPDAASAHCDLEEFGLVQTRRPAHDYDGSTLHRVVDWMTTQRGTTLRSLMRRSRIGDLRFPVIHGDNHWSAYAFHVALIAAGPSLAVRDSLYHRWQRTGSLTRSPGWQPPSLEDILLGQEQSFSMTTATLSRHLADATDRAVATEVLRLLHRSVVRRMQARLENHDPLPDRLAWDAELLAAADVPPPTRALVDRAIRDLRRLEVS